MQKSLLTRAELAAERDRQAQAAAAAAAALLAQKEASDITHQTELDTTLNVEEKKEFETTEVAAHVPFEATSSTEPANHHETPDSKPTLSVTDGDDEATLSEDEELNRTRSESTAGLTRPRNYSIGARRNSSIFIRLPDLAGTSLIRKSSDAMNTSHLAANLITTSTEGDVEAPLEDHHQSPLTSSHKSRTFSGDSRNDSSIAEDDHHSHSHSHSQNTSVNYNNDSMDMNVSRFPLNESVFYDPMEPTSATQDVALFEHFIVVGASEQVTNLFYPLSFIALYNTFSFCVSLSVDMCSSSDTCYKRIYYTFSTLDTLCLLIMNILFPLFLSRLLSSLRTSYSCPMTRELSARCSKTPLVAFSIAVLQI